MSELLTIQKIAPKSKGNMPKEVAKRLGVYKDGGEVAYFQFEGEIIIVPKSEVGIL